MRTSKWGVLIIVTCFVVCAAVTESWLRTAPTTYKITLASDVDKTIEKLDENSEVVGISVSNVPISIISRAHTERKTDCEEDRFLVWQGHTSGLGSNLIIGATHALTFAAYTNRSFVLGVPHGGFPYNNPNVGASFSWKKVFDMRKPIFSPCAETFSEMSLGLSSQEEILENKKRVLVVNFDNGPGGVGWWLNMLMNKNVSGTKPFGYYDHDAHSEILRMFGSLSQETITACLLREILIYQKFNIRRSLRTSIKYVGVHARGGDKATEVTLEDGSHFIDALDEIKATHANIPSLYLSGDRLPVRKAIMQTFDNVFFLPELTTNPSEMNTRECRFPCLFYDSMFDILMLARGEIVLGTVGSGFSMLSNVFQRVTFGSEDSFSWHVGQEHAGLQKYIMNHVDSVRDSYFWDPRKDMGIEVGVVLSKVNNTRDIVRLLSIHPWAFLVSEETGMGAEAITLTSVIDCDIRSLYVTPGIDVVDLSVSDVKDLSRECHDRPFKILVASDQRQLKNLYGSAEMKVVSDLDKFANEAFDVTLDMTANRTMSFLSLLRLFQSNFGLPDITEDIYSLKTFLEGLDTDSKAESEKLRKLSQEKFA